jgi:hypothetical protein
MNRSLFAVVVVLVVLCFGKPLLADELESQRLIEAYANAVETSDLSAIKTAWTDLNNNKEAVEYMQKNMPKINYLFQVRGLYFQMADIEAKQAKTAAEAPAAEQAAVEAAQNVQTQPAEAAHFSVSAPEPNPLPTNGEIVARSKNAVLRDNREVALDNPNQNRQDNKTILQNRAEGFREQKFQQPPDVLVPRTTGQQASQ